MPRGPHRTHLGPKGVEPEWRKMLRTNIRNRRIALGLTQKELGQATGDVNQQMIQQIESPKCPDVAPNLFHLAAFADALQTTICENTAVASANGPQPNALTLQPIIYLLFKLASDLEIELDLTV